MARYELYNRGTGEKVIMTEEEIIEEVNRDRSNEWIPYTDDWREGLEEFTEYDLIGPVKIDPIHYDAFVELFYKLDINPYEFRKLYGEENCIGYFPNLKERKAKINVEKLVELMKGENNV